MSFTQGADQAQTNATDQLSFKVGDREFNAESAATKIGAADEHIGRIETENATYAAKIAELEAQLINSTKLDDALAQLNNANNQDSQPTPDTNGVSEEQVGLIATQQMEQYLANKQAADQQQAAVDLSANTFKETGERLTAIYGDKVDDAMASKAKELGITTQAIFDLAKNPTTASMLLASMTTNAPSAQTAPSGAINTTGSYNSPQEKFMDYGGKITSSTIVSALNKAGAAY